MCGHDETVSMIIALSIFNVKLINKPLNVLSHRITKSNI